MQKWIINDKDQAINLDYIKSIEIDDGKIRALFEAGWNLSSIALEAGCSAQTVRSHLETMGLLEVRPQDVVEKTE